VPPVNLPILPPPTPPPPPASAPESSNDDDEDDDDVASLLSSVQHRAHHADPKAPAVHKKVAHRAPHMLSSNLFDTEAPKVSSPKKQVKSKRQVQHSTAPVTEKPKKHEKRPAGVESLLGNLIRPSHSATKKHSQEKKPAKKHSQEKKKLPVRNDDNDDEDDVTSLISSVQKHLPRRHHTKKQHKKVKEVKKVKTVKKAAKSQHKAEEDGDAILAAEFGGLSHSEKKKPKKKNVHHSDKKTDRQENDSHEELLLGSLHRPHEKHTRHAIHTPQSLLTPHLPAPGILSAHTQTKVRQNASAKKSAKLEASNKRQQGGKKVLKTPVVLSGVSHPSFHKAGTSHATSKYKPAKKAHTVAKVVAQHKRHDEKKQAVQEDSYKDEDDIGSISTNLVGSDDDDLDFIPGHHPTNSVDSAAASGLIDRMLDGPSSSDSSGSSFFTATSFGAPAAEPGAKSLLDNMMGM
jgi:hypothetical protein